MKNATWLLVILIFMGFNLKATNTAVEIESSESVKITTVKNDDRKKNKKGKGKTLFQHKKRQKKNSFNKKKKKRCARA